MLFRHILTYVYENSTRRSSRGSIQNRRPVPWNVCSQPPWKVTNRSVFYFIYSITSLYIIVCIFHHLFLYIVRFLQLCPFFFNLATFIGNSRNYWKPTLCYISKRLFLKMAVFKRLYFKTAVFQNVANFSEKWTQ